MPLWTLHALGDVARDGEHPARLAEAAAVHRPHHGDGARVALVGGAEVAVGRAQEVVDLAQLVDQPDHLVGVAHQVRGKARGDDEVDALAARLPEVEQPPGETRLGEVEALGPDEGQRHHLGLEAAPPQLIAQALDEDLGAAPGEGHLGGADAHPPAAALAQTFSASGGLGAGRSGVRSSASSRTVSSRTCRATVASRSASSCSRAADAWL